MRFRGSAMRAAGLLALGLLLSGCGFQLRGSGVVLPERLQQVYLEPAGVPEALEDALRDGLRLAGAKVATAPGPGRVTLRILRVDDDRRVLSVDSVTGKVQEYELHYQVRFTLTDEAGKTLVAPQSVGLERSFRFSEAEVLGKNEEEAQLRREMRRDAANRIIQRLQAQAR